MLLLNDGSYSFPILSSSSSFYSIFYDTLFNFFIWVLNKVNNFGLFDSMGLMGLFCFFAAILVLKEELEKCRSKNSVPVFEEFIPLKKEIDQSEENKNNDRDKNNNNECSKDKKNWMSSVQLWNNNTTTSNNNVSDHHHKHNLNKLETTKVLKKGTLLFIPKN